MIRELGRARRLPFDPAARMKEAMDAEGRIDATKLEAWIIKSQIDPNDSDNEDLMTR